MKDDDFVRKGVLKKKSKLDPKEIRGIARREKFFIYLKEELLAIALIAGIIGLTIALMDYTVLTGIIFEICWIVVVVITAIILFNVVSYHSDHPERKNYEPMLYVMALLFIVINKALEMGLYINPGMEIGVEVFVIYYALALVMLSFALLRAILHKTKVSKSHPQEANPTKLAKISSVSTALLVVIFTVIIADTVIISMNSGAIFDGATTIDNLTAAMNPMDTLRTIIIIVITIVGIIAMEIKWDLLFDFDDPLWEWFRDRFRRLRD